MIFRYDNADGKVEPWLGQSARGLGALQDASAGYGGLRRWHAGSWGWRIHGNLLADTVYWRVLPHPGPTHGEGEKNARNVEKIKYGFAFERPNNRRFNQGAGNG